MEIVHHPDLEKIVADYVVPSPLGFGTHMGPIMASADYKNGTWGPLEIIPYGPISLDPCAKVLHYAQEIFEGMKAYKTAEQSNPLMFRPEENMKRFNFSARRLAMAEVPEEYFMRAIHEVAWRCRDIIPTNSGESLYLRPFMFATQSHVGIKPSDSYKFMVIASPCGSYLPDEVRVLIQRKFVRAVRGGTGNVKCGGNYAASLLSTENAFKRGFQQSLWLDAIEHRYVEELSGMNIFASINGELHTPDLTETILAGITRDSIITLAKSRGIKVVERKIAIDDLIAKIKSGECPEVFACGTAAIVAPLRSFHEDHGTEYLMKKHKGELSHELRATLLQIQETGEGDQWNWSHTVTNPNS